VFAITSGVRNELIAGGVDGARISLLPNAAEISKFEPRDPDDELLDEHRLRGTTVIGYIGSLNVYEGLDDLLQAVAQLSEPALTILIVGDGPARISLEHAAAGLGLADIIRFIGRVPPADVPRYFSVIDIFALPRKPNRVCELVSPIKPFEAMAMQRCILASNVAAQADIIDDRKTGRLFAKGNINDLTDKLRELIADAPQRQRLGNAARQWVSEQQTWDVMAARVDEVYRSLIVAT
jgi:glycosyltransferase involved in cell wall biosynthesis